MVLLAPHFCNNVVTKEKNRLVAVLVQGVAGHWRIFRDPVMECSRYQRMRDTTRGIVG